MNAALLLPFLLWFQIGPAAAPKLNVRLYAAHEEVAPGGQTELAVEVEIQPGWHIYHPILLDTGMATEVKFETPAGVTVGDIQFPTPTLAQSHDAEYLEYKGRITLLATLKVDPGVSTGAAMVIRAKVTGLACTDKTCVPVDGAATLTLPVAAEMGKPANEKIFEKARAALPPPLAQAPYLKDSALRVSQDKVPVGGQGVLAAVIRVEKNYHIQDRDPGVPDFVPARLFLENIDGIEFGKQVWPPARVHKVEGIGTMREQAGEVVIRIPFKIIDSEFKPRPIALRALFRYQACAENGTCFSPEMAAGVVRFEVVPAGTAVTASNDPLFQIPANAEGGNNATAGGVSRSGGAASPTFWWILLLAFGGGAILNIMPCVLPVISLKIFGFMQQAGEDRGRIFRMGLVYTFGIEFSFLILAVLMVSLKIPWGGLMQFPGFVIGMGAVVLAFALSLFGMFEVRLPGAAMDAASAAAGREGYAGAFFNGLLATALATPCTAPLLAPALGFLAQLPKLERGVGILTVGAGLAAPYLLLTAFPGWLRFLPKPGAWMVTFKQIMGFVLLATVVWLMSILVEMVSPATIAAVLAFFCSVGLACWLLGRLHLDAGLGETIVTWGGVVAVLLGGWFGGRALFLTEWGQIPWQEWRPGIGEQLAKEGYTAYIDYTAKWCLTCQANKKFILETDAVRKKMKELKVVPVKADFTNYNADIQTELTKFGREGVPLNLIYPAGKPDEPIVLPEVLTQGIVLEALEKAGPSQKEPVLHKKDSSNANP